MLKCPKISSRYSVKILPPGEAIRARIANIAVCTVKLIKKCLPVNNRRHETTTYFDAVRLGRLYMNRSVH